jgi:hypothetical protein
MRLAAAALTCLVLGGLIGAVAIADHWNKTARMNRAELAEWYCQHEGTRCGGASSTGIEAAWNERQLGYEIAVSAVGGLGLVLAGLAAARVVVRSRES